MRRRRTGPGLLRTVGRTAVVAGTATAVSSRVARAQHGGSAPAQATDVEAQATPYEPAPAPASDVEQLERLATLHQQGALDDAEFASAKQRILGGQ